MSKTDIWMPIYIGDYLSATSRLTTEQHGAYMLLLLDYWKNGAPPDNDQVLSQITRMPLDAWRNARSILEAYFQVSNGHWHHSRVERELEASKSRKDVATQRAFKASQARWANKDASSIQQALHEDMLEHTSSPSPSPSSLSTKSKSIKATIVATPEGVSESIWQDFVKHRKTKKAQVTQTVIDGIRKEAQKAGWTLDAALAEIVLRNWQSFKAEWVHDKNLSQTGQMNQRVASGLTRGLIGGGNNVKLLGN